MGAPPGSLYVHSSGTVSAGPSAFTDVCKLRVCLGRHCGGHGALRAYAGYEGASDMPERRRGIRTLVRHATAVFGAGASVRHRRYVALNRPPTPHPHQIPFRIDLRREKHDER